MRVKTTAQEIREKYPELWEDFERTYHMEEEKRGPLPPLEEFAFTYEGGVSGYSSKYVAWILATGSQFRISSPQLEEVPEVVKDPRTKDGAV